MALIPGSDFETGHVGSSETINLRFFLAGSLVRIQSAFYGLDASDKPAQASVAVDGLSVKVTVIAGVHGISCALISPSLATETVSLGQSGSVFATPTLIGGSGQGVVIIQGV